MGCPVCYPDHVNSKGVHTMAMITGDQIPVFVASTLRSGLKLYAATGIKPNRMWTPKAMMAKASEITGKKFKARDYAGAQAALTEWIEANG